MKTGKTIKNAINISNIKDDSFKRAWNKRIELKLIDRLKNEKEFKNE